MKILFIGNSYTYYNEMPMIFERLATGNQKDIQVYSVTKGGRMLCEFSESGDPVTQELEHLLAEHHFDICFIQEQSILPLKDYGCFISGLECVVEKVRSRADRLVLYATWGRKAGSKTLTENSWTTVSMARGLCEAYHNAAATVDADVSDAGLNFLEVYTNREEIELYDPDLSHPSYKGSCLAALTHYYTVFREFPENTDSMDLTREELAVFKKSVCK